MSEALSIKLYEARVLDADNTEILIHGKGGRERVILVPSLVLIEIRAIFRSKRYLFETQKGRRYGRREVATMIRDASERYLGYTISPHSLRRAFATWMASDVKPDRIGSIARHLGHSVSMFLNTYVSANPVKPEELPVRKYRYTPDGRLG